MKDLASINYRFLLGKFANEIKFSRQMRNPVAHGEKANLKHANKLREKVLGIGCASSVTEMLTMRLALH